MEANGEKKSRSNLPVIIVVAAVVLVAGAIAIWYFFGGSIGTDSSSSSWLMYGYNSAKTNYNLAASVTPSLKEQTVIELGKAFSIEDITVNIFAADEKNIYVLGFPKSKEEKEKGDSKIAAFDIETGKLRWEFEESTLGVGVIEGDRMYCVAAFPNKAYAIDISNGKKVWESTLTKEVKELHVYPPVVYKGVVYATSSAGEVFALDGKTGKTKWTYSELVVVGSPTASGGIVYCTTDDTRVLALDTNSGKQKWLVGSTNWKMLLSPTIGKDCIYLVDRDRTGQTDVIVTINRKDGKLLWQRRLAKDVRVFGVCASENNVFVSMAYMHKANKEVENQGRVMSFSNEKGEKIWSKEIWGMPYYIVGAADYIYVSSSRMWTEVQGFKAEGGRVYVFTADKGKKIEEYKIIKDDVIASTYTQPQLLISENKLYIQNILDNKIHVYGK